MHDWQDPPMRFMAAAQQQGQAFTFPQIGELFSVEHANHELWWAV
jgi:hypothetical protein